MKHVFVTRNADGDTRTATKIPSFKSFQIANDSHIRDVTVVMAALAEELSERGEQHDFTKKLREADFYRDFSEEVYAKTHPNEDVPQEKQNIPFTEKPWYKMHVQAERHHLMSNMPEDANLIDLIEMIVDCVCASKARSGRSLSKDFVKLSEQDLKKIVENTVEYLNNNISSQSCVD